MSTVYALLASPVVGGIPPLLQQGPPERIGAPWMGVVLPALMLLVSFAVTWALYRHFSRLEEED